MLPFHIDRNIPKFEVLTKMCEGEILTAVRTQRSSKLRVGGTYQFNLPYLPRTYLSKYLPTYLVLKYLPTYLLLNHCLIHFEAYR